METQLTFVLHSMVPERCIGSLRSTARDPGGLLCLLYKSMAYKEYMSVSEHSTRPGGIWQDEQQAPLLTPGRRPGVVWSLGS